MYAHTLFVRTLAIPRGDHVRLELQFSNTPRRPPRPSWHCICAYVGIWEDRVSLAKEPYITRDIFRKRPTYIGLFFERARHELGSFSKEPYMNEKEPYINRALFRKRPSNLGSLSLWQVSFWCLILYLCEALLTSIWHFFERDLAILATV